MNNFSNKPSFDAVDDPRWKTFQRDSQRRALVIMGFTIGFAVIAMVFRNVWLLLFGEATLWLVVNYWSFWRKEH